MLRWVQRNVEKFGGDPNNVMLFGESGGGVATQAVIATHGSKGLLHCAIPQSGSISIGPRRCVFNKASIPSFPIVTGT